MIRQHLKLFGASCAVALCLAASAHAGTIIGVNEVTGGGTAVIDPIVTLDPNNDNVSSPLAGNLAVISKIFTVDEPIDIVFDVSTSQGTSEYYIAEGVANVTGNEFIGYSFQLGFGTGNNFVMSGSDGLDFDTPSLDPGPTSGRFITLSHQDDWLRWTEGVGGVGIPHQMTDAFTLSIDVPDFDPATMPDSAITADGYRFTLRQMAVIPEPGTIGIALLSAMAWGVYALRRRWG